MSNDWYINLKMYPVLLNLGNLQVSSFGFFLAIGIFFGGFAVWRIARGYEMDAEKILDLIFLTLGAAFISARVVYILANITVFDSVSKVFFLNKYPGLSFWGGFTGGLLALVRLCKKNERVLSFENKISLLQAGDFGIVGFFLAAFFTEIGCLLGGCGSGIGTNLFFGVVQIGLIGKRLPVQFFEGSIFLLCFFVFWEKVVKFHVQGSLLAKGLILISLTKLLSGFFKSQVQPIKILGLNMNLEPVAAVILLGVGLRLYYSVNRKTPADDLRKFWKFLSDRKTQSVVLANISRGWYNHWVNLRVRMGRGKAKLFKLLNIKPNPDNF